MSTSSILYQGALSAGKWSNHEESKLEQAIRNFLDGTLTDCTEGESFTTYIASHMNCPVSRVMNKFLDKPILKARYLVSGGEFDEYWGLEDVSTWNDVASTVDFDLLLHMEQNRFLEYSTQGLDAFDALIERDCEFNKRVQKMADTDAPLRRRKCRRTPMSDRFKSCFPPSSSTSSSYSSSSSMSPYNDSEASTPRFQRARYDNDYTSESDTRSICSNGDIVTASG